MARKGTQRGWFSQLLDRIAEFLTRGDLKDPKGPINKSRAEGGGRAVYTH